MYLNRNKNPRGSGFTLTELLVVIAVTALVGYLAAPAFVSLSGAGTLSANASKVSDTVKEAYSAAVSRNTYVWVGFSQLTANPTNGVEIVSVYSLHGSASDLAANNVMNLSQPVFLPNLSLPSTLSNIPSNLPSGTSTSVGLITSATNSTFQSQARGSSQTLKYVMEITPSGQVTISPSTKFAWIQFNMASQKGNQMDVAVLQMNAFTGRVATIQP